MESRRGQVVRPPRFDSIPQSRDASLPRSASYTYVRDAKDSVYVTPSIISINGGIIEADTTVPADDAIDISPPESPGYTTPEEGLELRAARLHHKDLPADLGDGSRDAGYISIAEKDEESSVDSSVDLTSLASLESAGTVSTTATSLAPTRPRPSINSSFSRRNRRSWCDSVPSTPGGSRSPSPSKFQPSERIPETRTKTEEDATGVPARPSIAHSRTKSLIRRRSFGILKDQSKDSKPNSSTPGPDPAKTVTRRSTLLKIKPRPVSGLFRTSTRDGRNTPAVPASPTAPAVPQIPVFPTSFSTDKLPTYQNNLIGRAAPMPRLLSGDRVPTINTVPRKKDELWTVFRGLDADFSKFASKSTAFKANVVRSALLPFLRTYASSSPPKALRLEDLDRRANILNKWWTGLIEMLHGRNNQSISGTDRPAILDGISGIMERPEWRMAPSMFCALRDRLQNISSPCTQSSVSVRSGASDFLAESVHQNVRNIFVQNLSAQMAFVVDKMSLRNASASLVTFCGKACAYAFVFVPGMADVLVRLWDLQMSSLLRVLSENDMGKFDDLSDLSKATASNFPPAMQQMAFTSLTKFMRKLRTPPPLPLGTTNIEWWGHWLDRWNGRESDLFYVFVKYYHVLAADFLPYHCSDSERMCAPGMVPVHAQILVNLDATMHRDVGSSQPDSAAAASAANSALYDDVLTGPDAVASALPIPPTNAIRVMAENRLIMLIRDFLSDRSAEFSVARKMFALSFNALLHAAAKGISVFDHAACYTLLDFLEEALPIMVRFEHLKDGVQLINSEFWQSVCKRMISSENTMTEIRLYSFLYTVWHTVVCDTGRKSNLCLNLLLDPDIFGSRFNHWCPMVRAYFMRLLCWRVGRFDGEPSANDELILETLLERLQTSWSHHLYLKEEAAMRRVAAPATDPCNPAPSRRLVIIRTDTQPTGGSFLSFDGILPPSSRRQSVLGSSIEVDSRPSSSQSLSDVDSIELRSKGIGGFLRRMIGGNPKERNRDRPPAAPVNGTHRPAPAANGGHSPPVHGTKSESDHLDPTAMAPPQQHRNFCFKFSLEYSSAAARGGNNAMRLQAPRLPLPAQMYLQTKSARARAVTSVAAVRPYGLAREQARYSGRAFAEWTIILGECHGFFERRKHEGVPSNRFVETPTLGVEVFRRPT